MAGVNKIAGGQGSVSVSACDSGPMDSAEPARMTAGAAVSGMAPEDAMEQLPSRMLKGVASSSCRETALRNLAHIVIEHIHPVGLYFSDRVTAPQFGRHLQLLCGRELSDKILLDNVGELCQAACRTGVQQVALDASNRQLLVVVPVITQGRSPEVLCAILPADSAQPAARVAEILTFAASHVTLWYVLQANLQAERHVKNSTALLDVMAQVETCDDLDDGCVTLVNELQSFLGCHSVAIGVKRNRRSDCQLKAISGHAHFDRQAQFVEAVELAFEETLVQSRVIEYPPSRESAESCVAPSFQQLRDVLSCNSLVGAPLTDDQGNAIGAWLFVDPPEPSDSTVDVINFADSSQRQIGVCLRLLQRGERSWVSRKWHAWFAGSRSTRRLLAGMVALLAVALLCCPFSHKVKCDCGLQPVLRRFVAAPHDGILQSALVQPGDRVKEGQVLALIDGREVRLEIAALSSEYDQARKVWEAALSVEDISRSQQAGLEMRRLELKIDLLKDRQQHLEIRSPLDGVVISGDLEKSQGAPLTTGQTLFEIAPTSEMIVEIEVPEPEISFVHTGMEVQVRLEAAPRQVLRGKIDRIVPRAQVKDDRVVFVAKCRLTRPGHELRPGMSGQAALLGQRRSLAWLLFHRPYESLLMMFGW